ncbi:26844_t:CDS:2 [Dentiscutata erythropus]|uniref:26844_t:CDS:1 n=1 Tax=Dentiscutata erythropus TaxID=1348616 RepID=A0A9N8VQ77_9GLOM|nr:26844_t:CDS:2 [Dentiscutata erythropus]
MLKEKRKSYSANIKLDAINYAKQTSNHLAAWQFNVDHTQISRWRKKEDLKKAKQTNCRVGSGFSSWYPLAEELLKKGIGVTPSDVKSHMRRLLVTEFSQIYPDVRGFQASDSWFNRFMNRFNFSLHRLTKVSSKLPRDLQKKPSAFYEDINQSRRSNNFDLSCIANLDEIPIFFDMVGALTLDLRGAYLVNLRTTANDKNHFTCVLGVLANSTKLPPMVIFKGKRKPRGQFPPGLIIRMQSNRWMNEKLMIDWIKTVWLRRAESQRRSLLVLNSFKGHIMEAWNDILPEIIVKSFKRCGISNALDSLENELIGRGKDNNEHVVIFNNENENEEGIETISLI